MESIAFGKVSKTNKSICQQSRNNLRAYKNRNKFGKEKEKKICIALLKKDKIN